MVIAHTSNDSPSSILITPCTDTSSYINTTAHGKAPSSTLPPVASFPRYREAKRVQRGVTSRSSDKYRHRCSVRNRWRWPAMDEFENRNDSMNYQFTFAPYSYTVHSTASLVSIGVMRSQSPRVFPAGCIGLGRLPSVWLASNVVAGNQCCSLM